MHTFHETELTNVTGYQIAASYDLSGYRDFNFQIWAQGQPNANFSVLVYFNQVQGHGQTVTLNSVNGAATIQGTLPIYAPLVGMHVIGPATPFNAKVRVYAACCGGDAAKMQMLKRPSRRILRRVDENLKNFVRWPQG
jgi:hypothetical protein